MTPADIGAELWPHFDPEPAERAPSAARAEKDEVARMEAPESRAEEPRRSEPPAPVLVEAQPEHQEPEPQPMPPAPPPAAPRPEVEAEAEAQAEAESSSAPRRTGWWRRR